MSELAEDKDRTETLQNPELVELPSVRTLSLIAEGGPETAPAAFVQLEEIVPLKGHKFYGVYDKSAGIYRVCSKQEEGEEPDSRLETYTIPGGLYAYRKLKGEHDKLVMQIPGAFEELSAKYTIDHSRPSIEFYRGFAEFRLYLPVTT